VICSCGSSCGVEPLEIWCPRVAITLLLGYTSHFVVSRTAMFECHPCDLRPKLVPVLSLLTRWSRPLPALLHCKHIWKNVSGRRNGGQCAQSLYFYSRNLIVTK
jgi:hypothetical protein